MRFVFILAASALFLGIGIAGYMKRPRSPKASPKIESELTVQVPIPEQALPKVKKEEIKKEVVLQKSAPVAEDLPSADRIHQLFSLDASKLPIVETLSYTSRVPWLKGRPAWIADYSTHYATSRHFIARSLNRKPDYFTQKISPGDKFNVFRSDKTISFHLLIDLSRCRLWLYYIDQNLNERVLLKSYSVGVGRPESQKTSGYLTPIGKYALGEKIAIYKPGTMGFFKDQKTEMIRVFGTRWIPFESEIEGCTEGAKGFGLHGAPWVMDPQTNALVEDRSKIGKYDSDGCIRLASNDMEEIFSIVITKPTVVELVTDFHKAKLPGIEK
jgi:hypothetical protein